MHLQHDVGNLAPMINTGEYAANKPIPRDAADRSVRLPGRLGFRHGSSHPSSIAIPVRRRCNHVMDRNKFTPWPGVSLCNEI